MLQPLCYRIIRKRGRQKLTLYIIAIMLSHRADGPARSSSPNSTVPTGSPEKDERGAGSVGDVVGSVLGGVTASGPQDLGRDGSLQRGLRAEQEAGLVPDEGLAPPPQRSFDDILAAASKMGWTVVHFGNGRVDGGH